MENAVAMEERFERFVETLYRHALLVRLAVKSGRGSAPPLQEARAAVAEHLTESAGAERNDDARYAMAVLADLVLGKFADGGGSWDKSFEEEFFGTRDGASYPDRTQRATRSGDAMLARLYAAVTALGSRHFEDALPNFDTLFRELRAAAGAGRIEERERFFPQAYRSTNLPERQRPPHRAFRYAVCAAASFLCASLASVAMQKGPLFTIISAFFLTIAFCAAGLAGIFWFDQRRRSAVLAALCGENSATAQPPTDARSIAERAALTSEYGVEYCRRAPLLVMLSEPARNAEENDDIRTLVDKSEVRFAEGATFFPIQERPEWNVAFSSQALFVRIDAADTTLSPDRGWPRMFGALKNLRPTHPIDGVAVVLPVSSLYPTRDEDPAPKAGRIAERIGRTLQLLARQTEGICPVWFVVSRLEELLGFNEFNARLPSEFGKQLFGWANPFRPGDPFDRLAFEDGLDGVYRRVCEWRTEQLLPDPDWENAHALYLFPSEFRRVALVLGQVVAAVFGPEDQACAFHLRGAYFTSSGIRVTTSAYECCGFVPEAAGVDLSLLADERDSNISGYFVRPLFNCSPTFSYDLFREKLFKEAFFREPAQ